jgi:SAM-dependent methyltransferase
MDASRLAFPDAAFDAVAFVDAAEHVLDIDSAIAEAARVLRPGGDFVVTAANRNSLNQIMTRKLGYPEFVTNYQHVREFALDEFEALMAKHRLAVTGRLGILLFPYWGIPGIDGIVRHITDDDPEVVEILREMGAKVGPRHAYAFALGARKER